MEKAERNFALLLKEINIVDERFRQYEHIRSMIKSWCVLAWIAMLGALVGLDRTIIWLLIFVPIPFVLLEVIYRRQQRTFQDRLENIRKFVDSNLKNNDGFDVSTFPLLQMKERASNHFMGKLRDTGKILRMPFIWFLYGGLAMLGLILQMVFSLFYCY